MSIETAQAISLVISTVGFWTFVLVIIWAAFKSGSEPEE